VSLDLIYGTPGESIDDWRRSLEQVIALAPDHVSAYALIVEDGTKLARQIRRGEVAQPDEDLQADMYELADACSRRRATNGTR
jgi:coproporphyrinogen III oxidase-like Fe-S oxidoreductase